ncbi:uncharacterized protein NEMAJ01_1179 [Nematocida major]|uniref:uncharacterized protein n=1 Tax=Nematocida major TaxID=1912982 RepID=UPI002007520A|nr:uncharacterized protein NEMAJ01_1179 [Nematocida major]KAH9386283.1 hypothetical protein NEMAJ01_1179 [Nematocida major]
MAQTFFVELLEHYKKKGEEISLLSAHTNAVKEMKSAYLAAARNPEKAHAVIEQFRERSSAFYKICTEIKEGIERLSLSYSGKGIPENSIRQHAHGLYTRLKQESEAFLESKLAFLDAIDERQEFEACAAEPLGEGSEALRGALSDCRAPSPQGDVRIQQILSNLNSLNTAFIELSEIVSSSNFEIEGAANKLFLSSNETAGVNAQIELATGRRKRRRWLKMLGVALLVVFGGCLLVFFGKEILTFIIKIKKAFK